MGPRPGCGVMTCSRKAWKTCFDETRAHRGNEGMEVSVQVTVRLRTNRQISTLAIEADSCAQTAGNNLGDPKI